MTTTATSTLANLSVTSLTHQIYLDVLGTDLGIRIWEVLEQQKAHIATESTPTEIAPTSPAKEAGGEPPLKEVEVPTTDTLAKREEFLKRNLGLKKYRPCPVLPATNKRKHSGLKCIDHAQLLLATI